MKFPANRDELLRTAVKVARTGAKILVTFYAANKVSGLVGKGFDLIWKTVPKADGHS